MTDRDRVQGWLSSGALVSPDGAGPTTVDLVRALYHLAGAPNMELNEAARALCRQIGAADHYVLVLIDGLGLSLLQRAPADGFFARHSRTELRSVFPSTTAAALTSVATAEYPAKHGVIGWWAYLPEQGLSATVLPFVERFGGRSLAELGLTSRDMFVEPSVLPRLQHAPVKMLPANIAFSTYSEYTTGGTPSVPFDEPADAFAWVADRIKHARGKTYTWLYLPDLDSAAHAGGVDSQLVADELRLYDALLSQLEQSSIGAARLLVTADHGLADVPPGRRQLVQPDDPLLELLVAPPSGEPAVPLFHVRPGCHAAFRRAFAARLGGLFALLNTADVEALGLLGPGPLAPVTRSRLGDFLAVAPEPTVLLLERSDGAPPRHQAFHAGLSAAEMLIPLVLA